MLSRQLSSHPVLRKNISQSRKQSPSVKKRTKVQLSREIIFWGLVLAFTIPVFRSGLKSHLTLAEFIMNHTIFGDKIEFIPLEDYQGAFSE